MKPLREVAESYLALDEADRHFKSMAYDEALAACGNAMEAARRIPEAEAFDHDGFDAYSQAIMAASQARLGRFDEALGSADLSLRYFNRRGELNQDEGRLWITAVYGRALALDGLGRADEALGALRTCVEMIDERKGEMAGSDEMRADCAKRADRLEAVSSPGKRPGYRAWWEFWS